MDDLSKFYETKVERALIARGLSSATIMATDGNSMAFEMEAIGDNPEEVLGDWFLPSEPGLYLFEGKGTWKSYSGLDGPGEPELEWEGSIRPVKPEEYLELLKMEPPNEERKE